RRTRCRKTQPRRSAWRGTWRTSRRADVARFRRACGRCWINGARRWSGSRSAGWPSSRHLAASRSYGGMAMPLTLPALTGKWVRLEPLTESHRELLRRAADDERIWAHTLTAANGPLFDAWFNTTVTEHEGGSRFAFTVRLPDYDRVVGS